jgi:ribosomal protein S12 methylthiotransferase accessory factor
VSSSLRLRSTHVNPSWEIVPYRLEDEERRGLEDLLRYYSPFGVIRKVLTYFAPGGSIPTYVAHGDYFNFDHVLARMTGMTGSFTGVKRTIYAGGKGHSLFRSFVSTLAELVERVLGCLEALSRAGTCRWGTYREMTAQGFNCLGPKDLPLFAPEQFGELGMVYDPYDEDTMLGWIEGKRLFSGESIWMPAQIALLFYARRRDEGAIGYGTTGGLATHINEREALYHGITELFERDAINVSWYCRIPPSIIEVDRPLENAELRRLLQVADGLSGKLTFYSHILDAPELPVLTVIELDQWLNRYAYYSGGGVDVDIESVMVSAVGEFGQAERNMRLALYAPDWFFAQAISRFFDVDPGASLRELNLFFKVVPFYGYKENFEKLRWYTESPRRVALSTLPVAGTSLDERWDILMGLLKRLKLDPVVFDFTPAHMAQARLMKVYIPELTLPCPPSWRLLGHPRYYELPQQLGFADRRLTYEDLNKDPHPYP